MSTTERHSPYEVASEEDLLYSLAADGKRRFIHPTLSKGRYWKIRLAIGYALIAVFVGLPHLTIAGKPGIFLDLATRQFTFFGVTFHPTDNLVLLALGASIILTVFFITAVFGRLWCGFGCPQLVYLEFVFRPIEALVEGRPAARRRRNEGPWTADKVLRKSIKWVLFALLAAFFSTTFVSYFVGWDPLWSGLLEAPLDNRASLFASFAVTALMLFDMGYFRDQMCTVACPYGRLQTVLYDPDTVIVGYDSKRGEPRGKLAPSSLDGGAEGDAQNAEQPPRGDCIDCKRCIAVCPTGMDIRRGLQMECVGCGQCVEACDEVMARVKKPAGLIGYTSQRELDTGERRFWRPRVFAYLVGMALVYSALTFLLVSRTSAEFEVLRNGREPFRMLPNGLVANQLRVRLTNNLHEAQAFEIELVEPSGAELVVSVSPFTVDPDNVGTLNIVVKAKPELFRRGRVEALFRLTSDKELKLEKEFVLLGPYGTL